MKVLIPYKLVGEGVELRYSIRSLYKHFKETFEVVLIGEKPEWYTGTHIFMAEPSDVKEYNLMAKVYDHCDGVFLYTNDDFFALQDFNKELPNYCEKTCADKAEEFNYGPYKRMYTNCPGYWLNFDVHTPMIMEDGRFLEKFEKMIAQLPIKTMYAQGLPATWLTDLKISGEHGLPELRKMIKYRPFFSTTETRGTLNKPMLKFLQELYPNPSPVE